MNKTHYDENESGLIGLLNILWKQRRLIALGTAGAAVLLIIIVLLLPEVYLGRAVVSLSAIRKAEQKGLLKGLEIPVYRRYSDVFCDIGLFKTFLHLKGYKDQWDFDKARDNDAQFFDTLLKPKYAFDEDKSRIRQMQNSILGIRIRAEGPSPAKAREKAGLLGEYILTVILNMQIGDYMESIRSKAESEIVRLNNSIIRSQFEIRYLKEKESLITNQLLKIPGIGSKTDRELVNADKSTEKYLSPGQQLVAVIITIKDHQIQINRHLREIRINQIRLNYIDKTAQFFRGYREFLVNDRLLGALIKEKETFFSGKEDEENKIASYIFTQQFLSFQRLQTIIYRFISGPTLPRYHFQPKRKRIVIAGFFLVFFVFVFLALLIEAWQRNGNKKGSSNNAAAGEAAGG
jgi:LPS O-antigen subunit length determinant protein (WzzB/FepE family)